MSTIPPDALAAVGEDVASVGSLGGGAWSTVLRIETASGRTLVLKLDTSGAPAPAGAEAHGLDWLRVPDGPRLPRVVAAADGPAPFLLMEHVARAPRDAAGDERLGHALASMHRAHPATFGLERDNLIAGIPWDNTPADDWAAFLGERRLLPLARRAADAGTLPAALAGAVGRLAARLPGLVGPPEPPARLHGDLWSGNVFADPDGRPVLIDPAVYGGHREIDLAMMRLFGGFSPRVFAAYDEAHPPAEGAAERIPLNQVLPLLVHVVLFGAGYVAGLSAAVGRYVPLR